MALLRPHRRHLPAVLLAAATLTLSMLTPTSADAVNRPDLKVTQGSVGVAGQHAERVKGRFTVRNTGARPAGASTAHVQVRAQGAWRYLTELRVLPLAPRKAAAYAFSTRRPDFVGLGNNYPVRVCVDVRKKVKESREGNNCRGLGTLGLELVEPPGDDLDYQPGQKFFHSFDGGGYYGYVSLGYDPNQPTALLVWLHGCGGTSQFDIDSFHANDAESFVTIAPIGAEGGCWRTPAGGEGDEVRVLAAANDAAGHFNLDPDKLVLGGYSSGGDLAYRTGYLFSDQVDAVLAANSSPFRDTGITPAVLQTGITKFRVVHLAHTEDTTYPIATVRSELKLLTDAGFAVTSIERPGTHYDEPAQGFPGTDLDIVNLLLPQVDPPN